MSAAPLRFEIVRTAHAQWHWRIVKNGRILASSENYRRKIGCERAVGAVRRELGGADVVEVRYIDDRLVPVKRPELPELSS